MTETGEMSKSALVRSPRYLDTGMGDCEPDEPVICRICGRPILKGEPRYREPEGDVHLDCRRRTRDALQVANVIGDSHCRHSAPLVSVIAEFDKIATGERTPGPLQSATRREPTEIDRREAETLDELLDEGGRFGMVSRDEDHATSSALHRPFIEAGGHDRIERLDDAGTWREGRHDLARAFAAEIGEDELGTRLDEGIRRIDEHSAVPRGCALQR